MQHAVIVNVVIIAIIIIVLVVVAVVIVIVVAIVMVVVVVITDSRGEKRAQIIYDFIDGFCCLVTKATYNTYCDHRLHKHNK